MAIVRALQIALGFKVNKKELNTADKAILGIKTKFTLLSTAITYAFSKITSFFGDIAAAAVNFNDLSKAIGTSNSELKAFQLAAESLGVDAKNFQSIASTASKLFESFKQGDGPLTNFARNLNIEIDREGTALDALTAILNGLSKIDNEQMRINAAGKIFGQELGISVNKLASNINILGERTKEFEGIAQQQENGLSVFSEFNQALIDLGQSWDILVQKISLASFPTLTKLLEQLKLTIDYLNGTERNESGGPKGWLERFLIYAKNERMGPFLPSPPPQPSGPSWWDRVWDDLERRRTPFNEGNSPAIINNIDITVPPGTTEEQAESMSLQVSKVIEDTINRSWQIIQNNNPMIEV